MTETKRESTTGGHVGYAGSTLDARALAIRSVSGGPPSCALLSHHRTTNAAATLCRAVPFRAVPWLSFGASRRRGALPLAYDGEECFHSAAAAAPRERSRKPVEFSVTSLATQ